MIPRVPHRESEEALRRYTSNIVVTARAVLASPANVVPMPVIGMAMAMLQEQERQKQNGN